MASHSIPPVPMVVSLPDDILLPLLKGLDWRTARRLSQTSRSFRVMLLDAHPLLKPHQHLVSMCEKHLNWETFEKKSVGRSRWYERRRWDFLKDIDAACLQPAREGPSPPGTGYYPHDIDHGPRNPGPPPHRPLSLYEDLLDNINSQTPDEAHWDRELHVRRFDQKCPWATAMFLGSLRGSRLPGTWMKGEQPERDRSICNGLPSGWTGLHYFAALYDLAIRMMAVAVSLPGGQKLLLGFDCRAKKEQDGDGGFRTVTVAAKLQENEPAMVIWSDSWESGNIRTVKSAINALAKTMGVPRQTVLEWVGTAFPNCKPPIGIPPKAPRDRFEEVERIDEISEIMKGMMMPTPERTLLHPDLFDSIHRLRTVDRHRHSEGLWIPMLRIVQHARAIAHLGGLKPLYRALCEQFRDQLVQEASLNSLLETELDIDTWVLENCRFTSYRSLDAGVQTFGDPPIRLSFVTSRGYAQDREFVHPLPTITFSATNHVEKESEESQGYQCYISVREGGQHTERDPSLLMYETPPCDEDADDDAEEDADNTHKKYEPA
ncbi:hypothetical protein HKX48_000161 [Thoreauomyces humboldtii]|nr:hypothetical protein HKX48_000161 [Thoreauomyces humboldtii]